MKVLVDEIQQAVAENEQLRDALAIKESERFSLRNKLCQLRKGYAHLEDDACLLAEENKRLRQVCGIDSAESDSDEFHANANLIAAAPDMYEALIRCVCELERASSMGINIAPCVIEYADGALRKARGEE